MRAQTKRRVPDKTAEDIEADGFSKPYDPAKHAPFAALIQGELKVSQQVGAKQNEELSEIKRLNGAGKQEAKLNAEDGNKTGNAGNE